MTEGEKGSQYSVSPLLVLLFVLAHLNFGSSFGSNTGSNFVIDETKFLSITMSCFHILCSSVIHFVVVTHY